MNPQGSFLMKSWMTKGFICIALISVVGCSSSNPLPGYGGDVENDGGSKNDPSTTTDGQIPSSNNLDGSTPNQADGAHATTDSGGTVSTDSAPKQTAVDSGSSSSNVPATIQCKDGTTIKTADFPNCVAFADKLFDCCPKLKNLPGGTAGPLQSSLCAPGVPPATKDSGCQNALSNLTTEICAQLKSSAQCQ